MINQKLLKLTSDPVFKAFMLDKETNKYKAKIIHLITGIEEERLLKAEYVSEEFPVTHKEGKVLRSDIVVKLNSNKKGFICLEMNGYYKETNVRKQNMYKDKIEGEMLNIGEQYKELKESIVISFDNYSKYSDKYDKERTLYSFSMREDETYELEDKKYGKYHKSYHIDLPKIKEKSYNKCNELEKLLKIFVEEENVEKVMEDMSEEDVNAYAEALDTLARISRDTGIIGLYDAEERARIDREEEIELAVEEAVEKTAEKVSHEKTIEIAKKLLDENVEIDFICKITNLSKEEIEDLK